MACVEHSLTIDEGQHVCDKCGTIFDTVIDEGAEWRQYEDHKGEDQRRAGIATSDLLPESSCGSVISHRGIAATNTALKAIQRLSCWSVFSNSERSWMNIFDTIQTACNQIQLPKAIAMDACGLYKQMDDAQKVRGETRRACMGAALFVACRNNGASRTHEEISALFHVNIRALCKAIGRFEQTENTVLDTQIGIAERLCASLHVNDDKREGVLDMLYKLSLNSEEEFEHTPKTIVSGVVAHTLGLISKQQMKLVSEASGVSVLSIHKIVTKLKTSQ
jgi:transcription initiation factor TFIIIB Brf1 subunit/transcription initiation factor TFIIB